LKKEDKKRKIVAGPVRGVLKEGKKWGGGGEGGGRTKLSKEGVGKKKKRRKKGVRWKATRSEFGSGKRLG